MAARTYWIWFAGAAAWWFDAAIAVHYGNRGHALLALLISALFFIAGMVWVKTPRKR
jgi:hypothetical protein